MCKPEADGPESWDIFEAGLASCISVAPAASRALCGKTPKQNGCVMVALVSLGT